MGRPGVTDAAIVLALHKLLRDGIDAGTYVVLQGDERRNYYIQFALQEGVVFCEAVHNRHLEPGNRIRPAQVRRLLSLGWERPRGGSPNWVRTFEPRTRRELQAIVGLVRRAFCDVYGLAKNAPLTMECSWDGQFVSPHLAIPFASEGHRSTWEKVATCAGRLFRNSVSLASRAPLLFVRRRSLTTTIMVRPVEIHSSLVDVASVLARGVVATPALMRWLLAQNRELRFGMLSLSEDGEVGLSHSLVGDSLSDGELQVVLPAFVESALRLRTAVRRAPGLRASGRARRSAGHGARRR
ncbi:MAG TPA: YbjN domain-containing protein [Vicinamibacteria bacterium]|nr:YbjN domain-containing protein [Vicinamibacteria bacterium]